MTENGSTLGLRQVAAIAFGAAMLPLAVAAMPQAGEPVVVFAPFARDGAIAVMAAAEGRLIAAPANSALVVAHADDPAFVMRLYRAGATLVLSARFAFACDAISRRA